MITEVVGDLLDTDKCNVIVHQANLYHTFGGGIAYVIRQKFPEAFEADKKTPHGDESKLGSYSVANIIDSKGTAIRVVVNLYSQAGIGGQDRNTRYDHMVNGLTKLRDKLEASKKTKYVLGIPFQLGCGLANGSWTIVRAIIEDIFAKSSVQVYIYTLPELAAQKV
jgi:O-acetyl-ADP-ribose deacetylase (regulator of RNase III)